MCHKTQSHCSPNLIPMNSLNKLYAYNAYIFFQNSKSTEFSETSKMSINWAVCLNSVRSYITFLK
jgi:hypothetical protein